MSTFVGSQLVSASVDDWLTGGLSFVLSVVGSRLDSDWVVSAGTVVLSLLLSTFGSSFFSVSMSSFTSVSLIFWLGSSSTSFTFSTELSGIIILTIIKDQMIV